MDGWGTWADYPQSNLLFSESIRSRRKSEHSIAGVRVVQPRQRKDRSADPKLADNLLVAKNARRLVPVDK